LQELNAKLLLWFDLPKKGSRLATAPVRGHTIFWIADQVVVANTTKPTTHLHSQFPCRLLVPGTIHSLSCKFCSVK